MLKNRLFPMHLQFFAEEDPKDPEDPKGKEDDDHTEDEPITLTQAELQSKLDAESERRLQKVLAKKQSEWDQQIADAVKKAKEEGESYATMTEKQRQEAEAKAEREEFEKERAEFQREKLTLEVQADLMEKGLPKALAPALVTLEEKEAISKSVNDIKAVWDEAIGNAVKDALKQKDPVDGTINSKVTPAQKYAKEANERKKQNQTGPNPWTK